MNKKALYRFAGVMMEGNSIYGSFLINCVNLSGYLLILKTVHLGKESVFSWKFWMFFVAKTIFLWFSWLGENFSWDPWKIMPIQDLFRQTQIKKCFLNAKTLEPENNESRKTRWEINGLCLMNCPLISQVFFWIQIFRILWFGNRNCFKIRIRW